MSATIRMYVPFTSARVVPQRISPVMTSSTLMGVAMIDS